MWTIQIIYCFRICHLKQLLWTVFEQDAAFLAFVPRYHAYLRSWLLIKLNAMVYTSLYAFPGVYKGEKKVHLWVSVESWEGGGPPPYGQCPQIKMLFFRDGFPKEASGWVAFSTSQYPPRQLSCLLLLTSILASPIPRMMMVTRRGLREDIC